MTLRRNLIRTAMTLFFLIAAAGLSVAGTLDEILKAGEIRVGVNPTLPPRAMYDDSNVITGFEPELAALVAKKLGVKLTLVPVGSPDRVPFVAAGDYGEVQRRAPSNRELSQHRVARVASPDLDRDHREKARHRDGVAQQPTGSARIPTCSSSRTFASSAESGSLSSSYG